MVTWSPITAPYYNGDLLLISFQSTAKLSPGYFSLYERYPPVIASLYGSFYEQPLDVIQGQNEFTWIVDTSLITG